jgi:hypothetical protein
MYIISYNVDRYFVKVDIDPNSTKSLTNGIREFFVLYYKSKNDEATKKIKSLLFLKGIKLEDDMPIEIDEQTFDLIEKYTYLWALH